VLGGVVKFELSRSIAFEIRDSPVFKLRSAAVVPAVVWLANAVALRDGLMIKRLAVQRPEAMALASFAVPTELSGVRVGNNAILVALAFKPPTVSRVAGGLRADQIVGCFLPFVRNRCYDTRRKTWPSAEATDAASNSSTPKPCLMPLA
jgi:hypothetical protein